jgi:signal transduction histidine kinase/CheY-like chemotaxis protein
MNHSRLFARTVVLPALLLTCAAWCVAQPAVTLQQAGSRTGPDFVPAFEGQELTVQGQVSSKPLWAVDVYYLPIQDATDYGLLLAASESQLKAFAPGDWVEAAGSIIKRAGLPVLSARTIRKIAGGVAPAPKSLQVSDLAAFRYLGVLVTTDSTTSEAGENAGGDFVSIGEKGNYVRIFLPKTRRDAPSELARIKSGDRVRVTGIATQYCTLPPYDRFYQILIPAPTSVTVLRRAWLLPPELLLALLISIGVVLGAWWIRERRMAAQRRRMRVLNSLAEEVFASASPAEILRKLSATLPRLSKHTAVSMYIYNRGTKALESVQAAANQEMNSVVVDAPSGPMGAALALCFRNRTLIAIPDTRRSPFFKNEDRQIWARSVMSVPMFAQSELLGVLALDHGDQLHHFFQEEQAAMQHLANQIATALKLQEQQSIREQLFRSEKLAAAGQLISGVANELRSPLDAIRNLASGLRSKHVEGFEAELQMIGGEAERAAEIVARLVSFATVETAETQAVDVNEMLAGLLQFRGRELELKGIEVQRQLAGRPLLVLGSRGQLEQVFLNLLVDAEHAAAEAKEKLLTVSSGQLARRVLVEIVYQTRSREFQKPEGSDNDYSDPGMLGLAVCRGIVQSHGGDFRSIRASQTQARFEVELPVLETKPGTAGVGSAGRTLSRQLTVLLVEPDSRSQRQLVHMFSNRGDRVVPVSSAEEAADLVPRVRFDMAVCAARLPGWNWLEFFERVRNQVGGFVLLADRYDADLARAFQGGEGFVLAKPVDEADLHRICHVVEERSALRT